MDKEKCLSCEKEISADSNFCSHCGKKQKSVCNCWVKEKPYRGGEKMVANIEREWEEKYKPAILRHKKVPKEIVADLLDVSTQTVDDMLRSGDYHFGIARHCAGGKYKYEIHPLRFIAWYEGRLL
ncbi:MAG: hypothetical protein U0N81_12460 [[Eubacterium] siraeum]